jgi:hypothetical protein|tara:strand:- start:602 stop:799 length:198 start_codon:yes stop_codon:yes gene_type:complete
MTSDTNAEKVLEIHRRMVDKTVRVLEGSHSWIGKVMDVVDTDHFLIRRNKDSEPKKINIFDVRSL